MNRKNFELGVQRLYYVGWAIAAISCLVLVFNEHGLRFQDVLVILGTGFILPGVAMLAVRWIYRGFLPRAAAD